MTHQSIRRFAAIAVLAAVIALVICDLVIRGNESWWNEHSFVASVVASLLVLGVTALIVDEVIAQRQQRERGVTVAVQAFIVYGQARRAAMALTARSADGSADQAADGSADGSDESLNDPRQEFRTFSLMLLTAAPSLFDDPAGRPFLEELERLSGLMFRVVVGLGGHMGDQERTAFDATMARLQTAVAPMFKRIPERDQSLLEGF